MRINKNKKPGALIFTGYGINCDYETQYACSIAGFDARRVHLNDILENPVSIMDYKLVVFPGGFSFGDDLGAGVAFAAKIKYSRPADGERLMDVLLEFVERDRLILGICNGFQILVRLGLVPATNRNYGKQEITLAPNKVGYFIDRWVTLKINESSKCVFTRGLSFLKLPVRHGEGRVLAKNSEVLQRISDNNQIVVQYCDEDGRVREDFPINPNGSVYSIAGICDHTGKIFGLMPHPEAAIFHYNYPDWTSKKGLLRDIYGDGLMIFKNGFEYVR